jgi:hypothetical protein
MKIHKSGFREGASSKVYYNKRNGKVLTYRMGKKGTSKRMIRKSAKYKHYNLEHGWHY